MALTKVTSHFITGTITNDTSGNAATVTNGIYTTDSHSNPSWITGLAWSKITGAPAFITGITSSNVTTALGFTPVTNARQITINGTSFDLSADRSWTITSMIYPSAGIPISTGSGWGSSITNNSSNWNTAYGWGNHASAGYLTSLGANSVDSDNYVDGSIDTAHLADSTSSSTGVTYAKMQKVTNMNRILGRISPTDLTVAQLTKSDVLTMLNVADGANNITNNNQLTNGAGYITSADGGNAGTLDSIDSSSFLRSDAADTASQRINFINCDTNNHDTIATATGSLGAFEVYNYGVGNDAFLSFHVGGDYAIYFGLDGGTNKLSVGGWSMGANSYEIYHAGNKPSLATLGFTGASNANYITNTNQLTNGNGYITSADGGNAGTLDGYDHSQFNGILARYITTAGSSGRIRITAPFNTNSSKMFQVTVDIYNSYTIHSYKVGAYMYSTTNQWYAPTAVYTGNGSPDIYVGRDSSGKAYISIANGNYTGVIVHSFTGGYAAGTADAYVPWTVSINAGSENSVGVSVTTTVTSSNYSSYALPVSGGALTGNLNVNYASGNYGSQVIAGQSAVELPYTLQDTNHRPVLAVTGKYPVIHLNHTVTSNTAHGPTIQFTYDGYLGRQWLFGGAGNGEDLMISYSDTSLGNSNYNPHNGISGYQGVSYIMCRNNGTIGIGSSGDWGVYGGGDPQYAIDTRGVLANDSYIRLTGSDGYLMGGTITSRQGSRFIDVGYSGSCYIEANRTGSGNSTVIIGASTNGTGIWSRVGTTNGGATHSSSPRQFTITMGTTVEFTMATNGVMSGDFNDTSDVLFKKNIANHGYGLAAVNTLKPREFNWKRNTRPQGKQVGFVAQEVEEIIPEVVHGYDGAKSINGTGLISVLTKAIQELSQEVTALKAEVELLKQ